MSSDIITHSIVVQQNQKAGIIKLQPTLACLKQHIVTMWRWQQKTAICGSNADKQSHLCKHQHGNIKSNYTNHYNCAKTAFYATNMIQSTASEHISTRESQQSRQATQKRELNNVHD